MFFSITNNNLRDAFPLVPAICDIVNNFDKESGLDFCVVDINDIGDLISLDSAARCSDPYYSGMFINGNTISLLRHGESYNGGLENA